MAGCANSNADDTQEKQAPAPFYYKHWFKLTVQQGDTFMYKPCNQDITQILFGNIANVINMTWIDTAKVHRYNVYQRDSTPTDVQYQADNIDTKNQEYFYWSDGKAEYLCFWRYGDEKQNLGLFVDEDHKHLYRVVEESPCSSEEE